MNDLNRLDLNLLTVFAAVAQTRSVTLAAQRLALSQPAVSHALGRLRKAFDDPLFVRSREGLVPTVRGRTLMAPIQAILDSVGGLFHSPPFDQETSRREFRIGASDYAIMTVAPRLIRAVHLDAPHVKLEITPICEHPLRALEAGDLDGALWNTSSSGGNFCGQELFREKFMGLIWERHPLAAKARKGALSVEDYLAYPPPGSGACPRCAALRSTFGYLTLLQLAPGRTKDRAVWEALCLANVFAAPERVISRPRGEQLPESIA